jgi:HEAT repeat protein
LCLCREGTTQDKKDQPRSPLPATKENIPSTVSPEIRALIERTFSPDPVERTKAVKELRKLGPRAIPAIPYLMRLLGDYEVTKNGEKTADEAWDALRDLGDLAIDPLIAGLGNPKQPDRRSIVILLSRHRRAVPAMISALKDEDEDTRYMAVIELGDMSDARAVEPLIQCLNDSSHNVASAAARALATIGDKRAVTPLIVLVENRQLDKYRRSSAADALGQIGDKRAVDPLIALLKDREMDEDVRSSVARALGEIGDQRALAPLLAVCKDAGSPECLLESALYALRHMKTPRLFETFHKFLDDKREKVRIAAAWGLAGLGDAKSLALLKPILKAERPKMPWWEEKGKQVPPLFRTAVACALISTGDSDSIDAVYQEALASCRVDPLFSGKAIVRLAMSPKPRAYLHAIEALNTEEEWLHAGVTGVLATSTDDPEGGTLKEKLPALEDRRVLEALMKVAENSKESNRTRENAKAALRKSGDKKALGRDKRRGENGGENGTGPILTK